MELKNEDIVEKGVALIKSQYKRVYEKDSADANDEPKAKRKNRKNFIKKNDYCNQFLRFGHCKYENCRFSHDVEKYSNSQNALIDRPCIYMENYNSCPFGITCRFIHGETRAEQPSALSYQDTVFNKAQPDILKQLSKQEYNFRMSAYISDIKNDTLKPNPDHPKIDLSNKLYLAPLTTHGNLPFRRICKRLGADVTCSEMVDALSLIRGKNSEWALLRRHKSEDIFGVQIGGSNTEIMIKAAELITDCTNADFIDINMGCPIDLFFQKGAGCALMSHPNKVLKIINGITNISTLPLTLKMRTGIKKDLNIAHKIIVNLSGVGLSAVTLHGRSREQRYTKLADWDYIKTCAEGSDIPLIGNGDILSFEDYEERTSDRISGVMIGRGAIIKPWIFTEIKEKRMWDISSKERLEIVKEFTENGLEHWGSDSQGVEKTRVFLMEWLSFHCRYVPVGILEHPPHKINERPESFIGRDDLETLLSSKKVDDWVKISSMFLGPPKEGFKFVAKHNSTSYG